jgi:hypothetical protein
LKLHPLTRIVGGRRRPAGSQRCKEVADTVEVVIGLLVFGGLVLRWNSLDRELQIFAIRIFNLGDARPRAEHAAERRRAGLDVQHAAGSVRKRRRVDLVPALRRGASRSQGCEGKRQADNQATEHATTLADARRINSAPTKDVISSEGGYPVFGSDRDSS